MDRISKDIFERDVVDALSTRDCLVFSFLIYEQKDGNPTPSTGSSADDFIGRVESRLVRRKSMLAYVQTMLEDAVPNTARSCIYGSQYVGVLSPEMVELETIEARVADELAKVSMACKLNTVRRRGDVVSVNIHQDKTLEGYFRKAQDTSYSA